MEAATAIQSIAEIIKRRRQRRACGTLQIRRTEHDASAAPWQTHASRHRRAERPPRGDAQRHWNRAAGTTRPRGAQRGAQLLSGQPSFERALSWQQRCAISHAFPLTTRRSSAQSRPSSSSSRGGVTGGAQKQAKRVHSNHHLKRMSCIVVIVN